MKINQHQKNFKEAIEKERQELGKRPEWLKVRLPSGENYKDVHRLMRKSKLNTVCEEAKCPNIAECWNRRTATFMILGDVCTRSCGFCNVKLGLPTELDLDEPRRVAESVEQLKLNHVVITSVNRDELKDGGASIFSETVRLIRSKMPSTTIEILIPDFKGETEAFEIIMQNPPDILNHNLETVKRLYHAVRPQAKYERSLKLIEWFKQRGLRTKSGIMVGIGESKEEVFDLMKDLYNAGCDIMTIGQYLQPTKNHLPVHRYVTLEEFKEYKDFGMSLGFKAVESSPLVRSSYHADKHAELS
ncbi:lipoyl synthase [Melioribacter roseus P3M-2]|jgi:lipoic acid synthetase|uniref:Lipoyl synthase n=1 Tax=Melioribacter roseus (strain DSM 23840 / JCM 17771 / VKM B-2668 / P3M-2) TaxID=1191523 RepID=I6Z8K7_MELRP|nr:lipoyl synthase [Melioribacter roseus]AFN75490.1 lipoyl synthase [Melioribacter roseus P3M-2]